jgi:hypothetical protein
MAEDDWYRLPVAVRRKMISLTALAAGIFSTIASLIGYDAGRYVYRPEDGPPSRWLDAPIWEQLVVGLGLIMFSLYRLLWKSKSSFIDKTSK